ncbi:FAD-binding oxidoreductase [Flavobacterium agricola]|uniref:FAD-binding oxidoreductase n=2 Tax=Flavobacterium agricola TaxID=2870839 RepID=A0ABY6M234_9FLAO|nr:FAD-binding oxidoreductase [Flavobacterium agricola]
MKDFLIVGLGLAGISFSETLRAHNKSFTVISDQSFNSSVIAGGMYNPVVLKRYSEVWKAQEQLNAAMPLYTAIQKRLKVEFLNPMPVYRKFASIEEQNNWFIAADKPKMAPFLSTKLIKIQVPSIYAPYGYGEVLHSGYLDTKLLTEVYAAELLSQANLQQEHFDYNALQVQNDAVVYKGESYKNIVFADGFGLHANPYFNNLPLDGTKGELLIIKAPDLQINFILKSSIFIMPIGNDLYKVGATYNWTDKTDAITEEGKQELLTELKQLITCNFEVVHHFAGVRPTVRDRRPLVGQHYEHKNLFVLNGLGTRGVMFGPFLAQALYQFIYEGAELEKEININRIYKKLDIRIQHKNA